MTDEAIARPHLRMLTGRTGIGSRPDPGPDALLAFALSMIILYPILISRLHSSITLLIVVVLLVWINAVLERQQHVGAARGVIALMVTYSLCIVILARLVASLTDDNSAATLERVVLLLPLSAAAGWMLVRTGKIIQYFSWFLVVGMITVLPAIYEYFTNVAVLPTARNRTNGGTLISPTILVRNGHTRAVVGSDHPLVLGAIFLALIPIAMYLCGRYRYLCAIWLYVGIATTGSNGPELVGALVLVICFVPPLARVLLSTWRPLMGLLAAIAASLFVGSIWIWTPQIHGTTTAAASNEYRAALYYLLPRLLRIRPFGYGLGGLPPDTWQFSTVNSGIVDVASTIDSELVYGAAQFGCVAVLVFVIIAVFGVRATVRNHAIGLSSLSTTLVGLFLSIHSWNSLGAFWFLGFGACAALVLGGYDGSLDWTGLYRPRQTSLAQHVEMGVT